MSLRFYTAQRSIGWTLRGRTWEARRECRFMFRKAGSESRPVSHPSIGETSGFMTYLHSERWNRVQWTVLATVVLHCDIAQDVDK